MIVAVVTAPEPLITWAAIKGHLRADSDDDQALVEGYIAAATSWLDAPNGWLGRAIGAQTLKATMSCFAELGICGEFPLPYGPMNSPVVVKYFDQANVEQTVDASVYRLTDDNAGIRLQSGESWPVTMDRADAVGVTYGAGFATVPPAILQAIMLIVGHWYRNRETVGPNPVVELPFAAEALLSTFRRWC